MLFKTIGCFYGVIFASIQYMEAYNFALADVYYGKSALITYKIYKRLRLIT